MNTGWIRLRRVRPDLCQRCGSVGIVMNKKVEAYGLQPVQRPAIKATKQLDLSGELGRQVVRSETKWILLAHQKTFKKLADM